MHPPPDKLSEKTPLSLEEKTIKNDSEKADAENILIVPNLRWKNMVGYK